MKKVWAASCIALAVVLIIRQPVLAAEEPAKADLSAPLVSALLKPLDGLGANDPAVWKCAAALKGMGEGALPQLRRAAGARQPMSAKLALGWALLSLGDFGPGTKVLASVVGGDAPVQAKVCAANTLGRLGRDAAEIELTRMLDTAEDGRVRAALAQALNLAATTEAAEAKATTALVRLARGGNRQAQAAAAIALAELDDFRAPVPAVLKELSREPTARGRLATKLLELRRLSDLMIREKEYTGSLGNPLLNEIKTKIIRYHIEPPPKEQVLVDAAARGMVSALHKTDPFSSYLSPKRWGEFRTQISRTYGGIGAHVGFLKDDQTGQKVFTAVKPIYSGPAYEAGLRSYDQFVEIDGQSVKGKDLDELRDMLRGLPDSVVACKVRRRGLKQDRELLLKIIRANVTLPVAHHRLMPGGIGYLRLANFGDTSSSEVESALPSMEKNGMKVLILDLRDNPGGLLLAARDIADKFLKNDKLIVYSEGRNKKVAPRKEMRTTQPATHPDFPMVVLVNGRTASAAEIVAGALQDHKRAALIGERTYGKGSVQQLMRLDATGRRAALKLTVARYFLPSGRSIHRTGENRGGIIPSIVLPFTETWTRGQFEKHRAAGDFYNYSLLQWPDHKKKLMQLAWFDNLNTSQYPGFDKWYDNLRVKTDRDSARRLLRQWIRLLTADQRGRDWPCDLQEDKQLQRAVCEAGSKIAGFDIASIPEYSWFVSKVSNTNNVTGE